MALTPRKISALPPSWPAMDGDLMPISQVNPDTGVRETRAMTHLTFQQNLINAVAAARQDLVDGFTQANGQINQTISDIQQHQTWIDSTIGQIEAIDTGLQLAIDALETKVDHPVQWGEIAARPTTFPPTLPISWTNISDKPTSFPASVAWTDVSGKPTTFSPALPIAQSGITNLTADLGNKAPLSHVTDTNNPHGTTKAQVGLGNVDNTSDANKPISTAVQTALNAKLDGPLVVGSPNNLTPAFGTAYQATVPSKPSFISAMINAAYTVTVASTLSDTVELRIGPVSASVANGTGGFSVATFKASITGIALVIGLGIEQRNQLTAWLPANWYWAIRRVAGTTATITSATDQSLG